MTKNRNDDEQRQLGEKKNRFYNKYNKNRINSATAIKTTHTKEKINRIRQKTQKSLAFGKVAIPWKFLVIVSVDFISSLF